MLALTDPERLAHFKACLSWWNYECYVHWKRLPAEWIRRELDGVSLREFARLMCDYVEAGGRVDEVAESREPWCNWYAFHHDIRMTVLGRNLYIETVLDQGREPEDSSITVVNVHDA